MPVFEVAALILDPDGRIILPKTAEFSDAEATLSYDISDSDPDNAVAKICYRYNERQIGCTYLETNQALFESAASSHQVPAALKEGESAAGAGQTGMDPDKLRMAPAMPLRKPLPPWICKASLVTSSAMSEAYIFAMADSMP